MHAVLIDRNFEFMPSTHSGSVKASIGVSCDTEDELLFLLNYMQALDLKVEYEKHKKQATIVHPPEQVQLKLLSQVEKEIEIKNCGTIASLEI